MRTDGGVAARSTVFFVLRGDQETGGQENSLVEDMDLLLWQLIDSGFPSGGFAHSGGLEASVHHGLVADADTLRAFARQTLAQAGRGGLPLVTAAHRQPESLAELDTLSDVFLSNPVANRASRAQGRALLTSVARSFPQTTVPEIEAHVRREQLRAHYAPTFGATLNALNVDLADTQRAFFVHHTSHRGHRRSEARPGWQLRGAGDPGAPCARHRRGDSPGWPARPSRHRAERTPARSVPINA